MRALEIRFHISFFGWRAGDGSEAPARVISPTDRVRWAREAPPHSAFRSDLREARLQPSASYIIASDRRVNLVSLFMRSPTSTAFSALLSSAVVGPLEAIATRRQVGRRIPRSPSPNIFRSAADAFRSLSINLYVCSLLTNTYLFMYCRHRSRCSGYFLLRSLVRLRAMFRQTARLFAKIYLLQCKLFNIRVEFVSLRNGVS